MGFLEIRDLQKSYAGAPALAGISFAIKPGECVGLLGPNGAGKTTAISLIAGIISPDQGEVLIRGQRIKSDIDAIKQEIGLVPQDLALFEDLSALENLRLFGSLYNLGAAQLSQAISPALELVGLSERARDTVKTFSGGMKRRLNLAAALLHNPGLLLLDEPTVGVDPQSRNSIFDNIAALRQAGKTVLYTTHYMEEVERLCDRVIILDHGKVVADDSLANLKNQACRSQQLKLELAPMPQRSWLAQLRQLKGIRSAILEQNQLAVEVEDLSLGSRQTLEFLSKQGETVLHFAAHRPNLESVFLSLTGNQLRDS